MVHSEEVYDVQDYPRCNSIVECFVEWNTLQPCLVCACTATVRDVLPNIAVIDNSCASHDHHLPELAPLNGSNFIPVSATCQCTVTYA